MLLLSRVYPIARPRKLPEELKQHDFLTLAQTEAHARTRIRWLGMAHLNEGRTYREVATYLCVKPETVKGYDEIAAILNLDSKSTWVIFTREESVFPIPPSSFRANYASYQNRYTE